LREVAQLHGLPVYQLSDLTDQVCRRPPMVGVALLVTVCSVFWGGIGFLLGWWMSP
jgi:hypothetical protein